MTSLRMILVALMGLAPEAALAHPALHTGNRWDECWVEFAPELTQSAFHRFAREFGSVSSFKLMSAPVPLGQRRVLLGVQEFSFAVDENNDAWNDTFAHPNADHPLGDQQVFPKVMLRVGVTNTIDVGAYYTRNFESNYGWLGLDAKYGMLRQSESMPISLSVRGAYTRTLYVDVMDMNTFTADVSAGRTFWDVLTPYAGVGGDLVLARETSDVVDLKSENQLVPNALAGAELRWWHLSLGGEAHFSALTSFQVQVAARF